MINAFRRILQAGALGMRIEKRGNADITFIYFPENRGEEVAKDIRLIKETLGLRLDSKEVRLDFGALRHNDDQIALLTRSMMEMLVEFSAGIDVPREHLAEGRARAVPGSVAQAERGEGPPRIHVSSEPPPDAYVAVRYRNYWFWIDDRDLASKRAFTFLRIFSSIAETGVVPQGPILTIPAN